MDYQAAIKEITSGQLRSVYLLWGEERGLREAILKALKKRVLGDAGDNLGLQVIAGKEITVDRIIETAETAPFFSEKQMVLVENWERWRAGKSSDAEGDKHKQNDQRMISYLANVPPFSCLVFTCDEKVDRRKKLFQAMEQYGGVIELAPLKGAALERWIMQRTKELGKTLGAGALAFLISEVGTSEHVELAALEQELMKMVLYCGERQEISKEDAEAVLTRTPEGSVFTLIDAVGQRQTQRAIALWSDLQITGQEPLKLLYLLARQMRLIWQCRQLLDEGYAVGQIASKLGVHPFVAQRVVAQGKHFDTKALRRALDKICEADWAVKSGRMDPQTMMQVLIIDLCNN